MIMGIVMPLSDNFTARVPLVSGEINKKITKNWPNYFGDL
jgi:hypothetical protein